jgi:uncharacterized protein involved in exopolysaccharide biosynthesis
VSSTYELRTAGAGRSRETVTVAEIMSTAAQRWRLLLLLLIGGALLGFGLTFVITPRYRAEALVAPHIESASAKNPMGALSGELGGLASLVGLDSTGNVARSEAIELLRARSTTARLIEQRQLLPLLFADRWDARQGAWRAGARQPSLAEGVRRFDRGIRVVSEDRHTGLVTVSVTWRDPNQAADWVTTLVRIVNDEMRASAIDEADRTLSYLDREVAKTQVREMQQALFRLVEVQLRTRLLAVVREDYALKVVDPATPPDQRYPVFPLPGLFATLGALLGGLCGALWILFRAARLRRGGPATSEHA